MYVVLLVSQLTMTLCVFSSGLNLAPVSRLRGTWEKLPSKYEKLFSDLQDLFDPSRNMAKYRNLLNSQNLQPPIIPLFPVIKKDLTFLHEGKIVVVGDDIIYVIYNTRICLLLNRLVFWIFYFFIIVK